MLNRIKDELCIIRKKVGREKAFQLCPVYILIEKAIDERLSVQRLCKLGDEMESLGLVSSKSSLVSMIFIKYDEIKRENIIVDLNGNVNNNLEQYIVNMQNRYHFNEGIFWINIYNFKDVQYDMIWWSRFFASMRKYKDDLIFLVECNENDAQHFERLIEKEMFISKLDEISFGVNDYFDWIIEKLMYYHVEIDSEFQTQLSDLLIKYEQDINTNILNLWINAMLWQSLSCVDTNSGSCMLNNIAEGLLINFINKNKIQNKSSGMGFR